MVGGDVTSSRAPTSVTTICMELSKIAAGGQPRLLAHPYSPRPRLERESKAGHKSFQWREGSVDLRDEQESVSDLAVVQAR